MSLRNDYFFDTNEAMLNPYVSALHTVSMSLADKIDEGTIKEIK